MVSDTAKRVPMMSVQRQDLYNQPRNGKSKFNFFHGTLICYAFTLPTISEDLKTLASGLYRSFQSRYKLVSLIVFYTEGTGTG